MPLYGILSLYDEVIADYSLVKEKKKPHDRKKERKN